MRKLLLPIILTLSGCGNSTDSAPNTVFQVETDNPTINELLPTIRARLPGLDKYAAEFRNIRVENQHFLTIIFQIPQKTAVPPEYMSQGHTCFIQINEDRTAVHLPKINCLQLMFDRVVENNDESWNWHKI